MPRFSMEPIDSQNLRVEPGPLLDGLLANRNADLETYRRNGGYRVAENWLRRSPADMHEALDEAGLRGRAGTGFPVGHKWSIAASDNSDSRVAIVNAHSGQPGAFKERFLLSASPHSLIEATLLATHAVGAGMGVIYIDRNARSEEDALNRALRDARAAGVIGADALGLGTEIDLVVFRSPGDYITGEESALLELMEGRIGQPRKVPPMPVSKGLFGMPTVVSNIETVLHAMWILDNGPESFRQRGTIYSPGTMIFSLSGDVAHPGLFELPLGSSLRELIFDLGGGVSGGRAFRAALPGGVRSSILGKEALGVALDYDSLLDAGSSIGSGVVIVFGDHINPVELTLEIARFNRDSSCGKCQPCSDGTSRTVRMLQNLADIDRKSADLSEASRPASPRAGKGLYVIQDDSDIGGLSYTDSVEGLEKIVHLCDFYEHRGDCQHAADSARGIRGLVKLFRNELEQERLKGFEASAGGAG